MTARRLILLALIAAASLAAVPAAQARSTKIAVSPVSGHTNSTFSVSFASPDGVYGYDEYDRQAYERYSLTLIAPKGCRQGPITVTSSGAYDAGDRVTLRARAPKRGFCAGVWRGKVAYEESLADVDEDCDYPPESGSTMCDDDPLGTYSRLRSPIGAFRLRVR